MDKPPPQVLYRLRDSDGALLYVGVSLSLAARMSEHRRSKSWWPTVASIDVEHFKSRTAVLAAEAKAIRSERPTHNIQLNSSMKLRNFRLPDRLWEDLKTLASAEGATIGSLIRDELVRDVKRNRKVIDDHRAAHDTRPDT